MINKVATLVFCLGLSFGLSAQDQVLLDIEGETVTVEEFDLVYNKNNASAQAIDPKTREEYLEMYINFKLKVHEAEELGKDTASEFIRELAGYRRQLAAPYLTDKNVTEELIKEAYDRKLYDVNAFHILIKCDANASPEDTMKAWIECQTIKSNMKDPASEFAKLARQKSDDPSAVKNGGDLGYFNVFQMVYPFESAAYNTEVGTVSEPVRTRFGYHLLWVKDKRPARGEIHTAHIMVKTETEDTPEVLKQKEQKINEIYSKLQAGEKFESLAAQYSEDAGSGPKGGELPWFGTGRMVKSFEDAAFALENDGDYSEPVRTDFGWHIIKRLAKREVPPYEDIKDKLRTKVERDGRGNKSKEAFYARTKEEYAYKLNKKSLAWLAAQIDDSYFNYKWNVEDHVPAKDLVVFTLSDKKYVPQKASFKQSDLIAFMKENKTYQRLPKIDSNLVMGNLLEAFVNEKLTAFEDARLEAKYPKFKALMQEYHDGILLFDLMDDRVWSAAVKDTFGLESFHGRNKQNYMWGERSDSYVFSCADSNIAKQVQDLVKGQLDSGINVPVLLSSINKESQLALTIKEGPFSKGDNALVDELGWSQGFSRTVTRDNRYVFVYTKALLDPQPKELDETRGAVISDYQNELEQEWVKDLRLRYKVTVYKENLN